MTMTELSRQEKNVLLVRNTVTKFQIMQRDGERCKKCKVRTSMGILTIDHIMPTVDGGLDILKNKQLLCVECHREKTKQENIKRNNEPLRNVASFFKMIDFQKSLSL